MRVVLFILLLLSFASEGRAADPAAGQALFDEAVKLRAAGDYTAACVKFAESQRFDPQLGTEMNLADCYEREGRTATAWAAFRGIAEAAAAKGQDKRAREAGRRASALEPKLCKLAIVVEERTPGLEVRRNEVTLSEASFGIGVPVDPGTYTVSASAPGKSSWSAEIEVNAAGKEKVVEVPPLVDAKSVEPDDDEDGGVDWVLAGAGIGLGVLGAAGLTLGGAFAAKAKSTNDASRTHCLPEDVTLCSAEGASLRDDAITQQDISIASFVIGGAALVTGVVLVVLGVSSDADESAWLRPTPTGISIRW